MSRLEDLRESRLAAIKAAHDKEKAALKELEEQKEIEEKFKPPSLTTQFALATKSAIRNTVDTYRRYVLQYHDVGAMQLNVL